MQFELFLFSPLGLSSVLAGVSHQNKFNKSGVRHQFGYDNFVGKHQPLLKQYHFVTSTVLELPQPISDDLSLTYMTLLDVISSFVTSATPPVTLAILKGPQKPFCDLSCPPVTLANLQ